jgi:hypothetical protein
MTNHTNKQFKTVLLTEKDLDKYPGIKKTLDECINSNNCNSKVDRSETEIRNLGYPYVKINGKYYLFTFYWVD